MNPDLTGGAAPPDVPGGPMNVRRMPGADIPNQPDPGMGEKSPRARAQEGERPDAVQSGFDTMTEAQSQGTPVEADRCRVCWVDLNDKGFAVWRESSPLASQVCGSQCARAAAVAQVLREIMPILGDIRDNLSRLAAK